MAAIETKPVDLMHLGDRISLDFANTGAHDLLQSYDGFINWCSRAGIVSPQQGRALIAAAAKDRSAEARVLSDARELREIITRIFTANAEGSGPSEQDLLSINGFHARAMAASRIRRSAEGFDITFDSVTGPLDWPLNRIAWSAGQLLMGRKLDRVKICSDRDCRRLFIDGSRNRSRRWCDMSGCGNRAKARRHYRRITGKDGEVRAAVGKRAGIPEKSGARRPVAQDSDRPRGIPDVEIGSTD